MIRPFWALALLPLTAGLPYSAPSSLFSRSDTCVAASLTSCSSSLPSNFCCPTDYACLALAADTTAICCPGGATCKRIMPIVCDIGLQNPSTNMSAIVKTTLLDYDLPKCGSDGCCPFGYECEESSGTSICVMKSDQSVLPEGVTLTTSSTSTSTSSSSSTTSSTSTSTTSSQPATTTTSADSSSTTAESTTTANTLSTVSISLPTETATASSASLTSTSADAVSTPSSTFTPAPSSSSSSSSTGKIVGGVAGAISGLVFFVFFAMWLRRKRNPRISVTGALPSGEPPHMGPFASSHSRTHSKTSPPLSGSQISSPMSHTAAPIRTDFIRKTASTEGISASNSPRYESHDPFAASSAPSTMASRHGAAAQSHGYSHSMSLAVPAPAVTGHMRSHSSPHDTLHPPSLVPPPLNVSPPYTKNMRPGSQFGAVNSGRASPNQAPSIRLVDQKVAMRPSMTQLHPGLEGLGVLRANANTGASSSAVNGLAAAPQNVNPAGLNTTGLVVPGAVHGGNRDTTITFMMHEAGLTNVQSGQPYLPQQPGA